MAEIVNTNPKAPESSSRLRLPKISWRLTAIIVLLAAIVIGLIIYHGRNNSSNAYSYDYKNLTATSIKLSAAPNHVPPGVQVPSVQGATISIQKPTELQPITSSANNNYINYRHQINNRTTAGL